MRLAVDNDGPVVRWLQGRSWKDMTEKERQSFSRRLHIEHAFKQVVRFGSSKA